MKNKLTLLIGIVLVAFLLAYMFVYQVRYDQVAVVETFGKAVEPFIEQDGTPNPGSVVLEPGLKFKLPAPFQKVRIYPRTVQLLVDQPEELQTADKHVVIVQTYLAWRISDPYQFATGRLRTVADAERQLRTFLGKAKSEIAHYRFDQLVNTDASRIALEQIESACLDQIRAQLAVVGNGIHVEQVGISRIVLPETVTEDVFGRMKGTRERLAQSAISEGNAEAERILSDANMARERILAFAERRANAIRDEGNREAAGYYKTFRNDPNTSVNEEELAVFLREIDALKRILPQRSTLILDANSFGPIRLLNHGPDTPAHAGQPAVSAPANSAAVTSRP